MTESQRSNYALDNSAKFSYTGPSLIGLRWSAMNTAKLTQGHEFVLESTQISNFDNLQDSEKIEKTDKSKSSKYIKYSNIMSKRVMSANPAVRSTKRPSIARQYRSKISERSGYQNIDNLSTSHMIIKDPNESRIEWEEITKNFVLNPKTRNLDDKIANRWISVEIYKTVKRTKNISIVKRTKNIPIVNLTKRKSNIEKIVDHKALNKTIPLKNIAMQNILIEDKKKNLIKIKAYDSALNRIISWNSIHK